MYAGELSMNRLVEWSLRAPNEVPRLHGEFWWIAITTSELADNA